MLAESKSGEETSVGSLALASLRLAHTRLPAFSEEAQIETEKSTKQKQFAEKEKWPKDKKGLLLSAIEDAECESKKRDIPDP